MNRAFSRNQGKIMLSSVILSLLLGSSGVRAQGSDVATPGAPQMMETPPAPSEETKIDASPMAPLKVVEDPETFDPEDAWPPGTPVKFDFCSARCGCFFRDAEDPQPNLIYANISNVRNALARECQKFVNDKPELLNGEIIKIPKKLLLDDIRSAPCDYRKIKRPKKIPWTAEMKKACQELPSPVAH